jgi:hypothetical protein
VAALLLLVALSLVAKALSVTTSNLVLFEVWLSPLAVQCADFLGRDAQLGDYLEQVPAFIKGEKGQRRDFTFVLLAADTPALRPKRPLQRRHLFRIEVVHAAHHLGMQLLALHASHLENADAKLVGDPLTRKSRFAPQFSGLLAGIRGGFLLFVLQFREEAVQTPLCFHPARYDDDHTYELSDCQPDDGLARRSPR